MPKIPPPIKINVYKSNENIRTAHVIYLVFRSICASTHKKISVSSSRREFIALKKNEKGTEKDK